MALDQSTVHSVLRIEPPMPLEVHERKYRFACGIPWQRLVSDDIVQTHLWSSNSSPYYSKKLGMKKTAKYFVKFKSPVRHVSIVKVFRTRSKSMWWLLCERNGDELKPRCCLLVEARKENTKPRKASPTEMQIQVADIHPFFLLSFHGRVWPVVVTFGNGHGSMAVELWNSIYDEEIYWRVIFMPIRRRKTHTKLSQLSCFISSFPLPSFHLKQQ